MDRKEVITVVSGLPRSGTSMMMAMLDAAGIEPIQDGIREADIDNPKGYYEFERVKKLTKGDYDWVPECRGKSVKIISRLLVELPPGFKYKVLWMRRNIDEIIRSQTKMLQRLGTYKEGTDDEEVRSLLLRHVADTLTKINERKEMDMIYVNYNKLVTEPEDEIRKIDAFFEGAVDINLMRPVIDKNLYRNRAAESA